MGVGGGNGGEVYLEVCPVGMWEMDCAERLDLMLHNGPLSSLCLVSCNLFVIYYPLITYNRITPFVQLVFHFVPQKSHSQAELAVENEYVEIVGRNLLDEKVTKGLEELDKRRLNEYSVDFRLVGQPGPLVQPLPRASKSFQKQFEHLRSSALHR